MSKKLSHASYLQIVKEFNDLLKKNNIDKTEYIKPVSNILCYNIDDVVEGKKNIDILMCPICLNILKDPISCNSTEKSHSFCKKCILQSLKINDKCPMCKQNFEFGTNTKLKPLLQKLKFKCKYAEEGCHRILDYPYYFIHLDKCEFKETLYECQVEKYNYDEKIFEKCKYEGTFKKLMQHFKKCAFLKYKCIFCNKDIFQINGREHFSSSCKLLINRDDDEETTYIGYHEGNFIAQGFGKDLSDDGTKYLGEFKKGKANGFGLLFSGEEKLYQGEWKNGRKEGIGLLFDDGELFYQGEFKDGQKHGIGMQFFDDSIYEGEWKNGHIEGYGILIYKDGEIKKYEGELKNDTTNGYGILYYSDGSFYNGEFKDGSQTGFGIQYYYDKEYYVGQHKDSDYDGYGIIYYPETKIKIKGEFKNNNIEGYCIEYLSNGDIIEGYCKNGKLNEVAFVYKLNGDKYIKCYEDGNEIFSEKIG